MLLNGELVAESTAAREGIFVPLTLLPGDNVLSVVVTAASGVPLALASLEELERTTVSDSSWKVSTNPETGYATRDVDDASWDSATDYGVAPTLADCDGATTFTSDSDAHWIGPATASGRTAVLRKRLSVAPVGYGAGTTGGGYAAPVFVATYADLTRAAETADDASVIVLREGLYDFRDTPRDQEVCATACTNDTSRMRFDVLGPDETCSGTRVTRTRTDRRLVVGANKTIVALGRGALIRGVSFELGASTNVILRNVALFDVNHDLFEAGDALSLSGASRVWVDHMTTKWISDDFVSVNGSEDVTFSFMHFDGVTDTACRGAHTLSTSVTDSTVTFHHSFFDHVESHSPRADNAGTNVHLFANLLSDNLGYAVGAVCDAEVLLEGNTFQRVVVPTQRSACSDDLLPGRISMPAGSNLYLDDVGDHRPDASEPRDTVFTPPYTVVLEPAEESYPWVLFHAGTGGPWSSPLSLEP